jgi:hypothetical protein
MLESKVQGIGYVQVDDYTLSTTKDQQEVTETYFSFAQYVAASLLRQRWYLDQRSVANSSSKTIHDATCKSASSTNLRIESNCNAEAPQHAVRRCMRGKAGRMRD